MHMATKAGGIEVLPWLPQRSSDPVLIVLTEIVHLYNLWYWLNYNRDALGSS